MRYTIDEIAGMLGLETPRNKAVINNFLTDSRSLTYPETTLFFALSSDKNDGHRYIPELYYRGVRNFVVERYYDLPDYADANFLYVDSPLSALQTIAEEHRKSCEPLTVIGITGSRGKTTIKEWLYRLLSDKYHISRSPRSFNSQIGVPLSVCGIDNDCDCAIIEAGISRVGEMERLRNIIKPAIGVFTNLGDEHNGGFSSKLEKCREKSLLFVGDALQKVVFCADDRRIAASLCALDSSKIASWSRLGEPAPMQVAEVVSTDGKTVIKYAIRGGEPCSLVIPFTSVPDIENAIHCIAVLEMCFHLDSKDIEARMARLTHIDTRIEVIEAVNNSLIVADNYTCDFGSLGPALDFMARRATSQRSQMAILSDLECEPDKEDAVYANVVELLESKGVESLIGIGVKWLAHAGSVALKSRFFTSVADFLEHLNECDFANKQILLKGAPDFKFGRISEALEERSHETMLDVNLDNLAHNFDFFRSLVHPSTGIVCMVKASGYGAGSYEIAKTLQDRGAAYLAVAVLDEGVELRKAGITMPVMVLNPVVMNYDTMFRYRLEPEIFNLDMCRDMIEAGRKFGVQDYPVHIKIDTGMHRLGFLKESLPALVELLGSQSVLKASSVFSHLAVADEPSPEADAYTRLQFDYFDQCNEILSSGLPYSYKRHILNTAGIVRFPEHQFDMVRLGIGLYGISTLPDGSENGLKPVSTLHSVIISIKEWDAGTTIGYGRHGVLHRRSRIATIPIGYADGFNRRLGNGNCSLLINGTFCPTVGNICMDVCMVDVTEAECTEGDYVEIFGADAPVERLSDVLGTIPYEVLTSVSKRVKRVYFRE